MTNQLGMILLRRSQRHHSRWLVSISDMFNGFSPSSILMILARDFFAATLTIQAQVSMVVVW